MALPTKKKRGLRVLTHKGIGYYWKVRVNDDEMERSLDIVIGLEKKTSSFFTLYLVFKDPFLHFPTPGREPLQSPEELKRLKALEKVSPGLIAKAIDLATDEEWQTKRYFALLYKDDAFTVTENWGRMRWGL